MPHRDPARRSSQSVDARPVRFGTTRCTVAIVAWNASDEAALRARGALKPLHIDEDAGLERRWMCWPPHPGIPYRVVDEDIDDDGRAVTIYGIELV